MTGTEAPGVDARRTLHAPAEANVIGSAMFIIALVAVVVIQLFSRQRRRMMAGQR